MVAVVGHVVVAALLGAGDGAQGAVQVRGEEPVAGELQVVVLGAGARPSLAIRPLSFGQDLEAHAIVIVIDHLALAAAMGVVPDLAPGGLAAPNRQSPILN